MPFIVYDETTPIGGEALGNGDNRIRELKVQIRERLIGYFPDWATATDRLTQSRIFVNTANLVIRNNNDTVDLVTVVDGGGVINHRPYTTALYSSTVQVPGVTQKFLAAPTEIVDVNNWHAGGGNLWRILVPVGLGGTFWVTLSAQMVNPGGIGANSIGLQVFKNGLAAPEVTAYDVIVATSKSVSLFVRAPIALAAGDYIEPHYVGDLTNVNFSYHYFCLEKIT
jgi:hypothetical protein